jgi:septal ring-binding cell division protein DamX
MAAKGPRPTLRLIDRLVLLVAWMVTSGIVYVLGYYVGKGSPGRQAAVEERSVRLPVTSAPPAEGQRPKEAKEFPSFYQSLPAGERPIDVARGTPVTAPPPGTAPAAAPTTIVRTTTLPATTVAPRTPTTTPPAPTPTTLARGSATPPPPFPRTATTLPTATASGRTESTLPSTPRPPQATTTPTTLARPATPPTTVNTAATPQAASRPTGGRGSFTVEASPTRSRSEADQLLAQLRRRGYDASIVQVERDGDTWYRLRVGRYATSEQATDTMRKLREVEGITHVFVATD